MRPINGNQKKILAWVAVTALSLTLLVGTAHSRVQEWTSAEILFTPPQTSSGAEYGSNCLVAGGQTILLAPWESTQYTKTISIDVSGPDLSVAPTLTPDAAAQQYLICEASIAENQITITMNRNAIPSEATTATVDVSWQSLAGTLMVELLPEAAVQESVPEEGTQQTPVSPETMMLSHCGVLNETAPQVWLTMEPAQCANGTLALTQGDTPLNMVRYSLDGNRYTLLYEQNVLPLPTAADWDGKLLLDFSQATLSGAVTIQAAADGYAADTALELRRIQPVEPMFLTAAALPHNIPMETDWGEAQLQLQVQKLTTDANGALVYEDTALLTVAVNSSGLVVSATQLTPGTYRILVNWLYDGQTIAEQNIRIILNTN